MTDAHYNLPNGIKITVTAAVLAHLDQHRQTSCLRREAGGQLFARISGKEWTIVGVTGPRKSDWRSRFGYRPDRRAENEEIQLQFANGLHFVGDWHTHPQKKPRASGTDIDSMNETVALSTHQLPGFLLLIVGTDPFPRGLWASFHSPLAAPLVLSPKAAEGAEATPIG